MGPADLSVSLGLPPGNNDGEAAFDEALTLDPAHARAQAAKAELPGQETP